MRNFVLLPCILLFVSPAFAADWKMDPAGSRLEFTATFEKTPAPGVFKEFDTRLRFDPDKPAGGSLDVTIKVTSADMAIPDVNKEIRNKDWFDCAAWKATAMRRAARCPSRA
jgi:polyisoprenoid-binding protein YceI